MATEKEFNIQKNIRTVKIKYNSNEKAFNEFLNSSIKNYVFDNDITIEEESSEDENICLDIQMSL